MCERPIHRAGNSEIMLPVNEVLKKAVLLVAFGTSVPEARRAYERVDRQVRSALADIEIRWAYTSKVIRRKLAEQGERIPSPELALAQMMDEGYTHVAVLSLHVFPGHEFHDLYLNANLFGKMAKGFKRILVARPMLSSYDDMERTVKALLKIIPPDRKPEDAVLFMGHGNEKHPADVVYAAMNHVFQESSSNVFVAAVQGKPGFYDILPKLIDRRVGKVFLIPFMLVAGEHARNDMAGDKPESWKSLLLQHGIGSETILSGIAEYPEIVEIWLDHLRRVLADL